MIFPQENLRELNTKRANPLWAALRAARGNENGNKSGKSDKHDDDTIIINIVGEHNGKVVVYPISSKN